jgi:hypothetical protein
VIPLLLHPLAPVAVALAATSVPTGPRCLPDEEVADDLLPLALAVRRADERYPVESIVTTLASTTLQEAFTQAAQCRFMATLNAVDPRVTAQLEQPFGKDNLLQYFYSTPGLRHVLLPLFKSGFLHDDPDDPDSWDVLCSVYYPAAILRDLWADYTRTFPSAAFAVSPPVGSLRLLSMASGLLWLLPPSSISMAVWLTWFDGSGAPM